LRAAEAGAADLAEAREMGGEMGTGVVGGGVMGVGENRLAPSRDPVASAPAE
jgi:hypothetical protein